MTQPLRIAVAGAGSRGSRSYATYCLDHPEEARVVAVAEPRAERRRRMAADHGIFEDLCFESWEQLLERPRDIDGLVIATPDRLHVEPTLKALEYGYDILLEKPIAPTANDLRRVAGAARDAEARITIGHVLRHTPFFSTIKRLIDEGRIGRLISIEHLENVGYWHFAHSFVRGNWGHSGRSSPMVLAKSCHDMDILRWFAGSPWEKMSSFGRLSQFREDRAPEGAPERCIDGCPIYETCPYNAVTFYVEALAGYDGWPISVIAEDTSREGRLEALRTGPYGRCVYRSNNDVVDHQVAIIEFANEVTATLTVCGLTSENTRTLKLMGSEGEIRGHLERGEIEIRTFQPGDRKTEYGGEGENPLETPSEVIDVATTGLHAGGDEALMRTFLQRIRAHRAGEQAGEALTSLEESLESHFMALAAEDSRVHSRVVTAREQPVEIELVSGS
ncbi:MAG: Gfo/Idh/MocA family protein [Actinomycetota bacterium]